ncbi:MAG: general secretion pathway protein GspD [Gammaproteobacteria bacterium]|nr:MAG: general secretion pathway protein GspD [Gammaproteobacteria bacterium]
MIIMKKIGLITSVFIMTLMSYSAIADSKVSEIEFSDTKIGDVVRTLSELSSSNIISTPEASEQRVTIHLKNVTVVEAIKSISRISDLWYRFDDDTNTYRIMTREQYGRDLIVRESEHIEVFKVLNANVQIIAQSIEDLYGSRVVLSMGVEAGQSMSSGSSSSSGRSGVRNSRSTSRSNRNSGSISGTLASSGSAVNIDDLSVGQIEQLAQAGNGSIVDAQTLQRVTIQAQPIYVSVNNEHNMIIVRTDDRKVIKSIDSLINKLDIPIPQVMLEMKILSIVLGDDFNSIFNFDITQPKGANKSSQPIQLGNNALLNSGSFIYEFLNSRLQANIEFLEQNKRIKVLSNPMVLASNHREAELFIGEETLLTRGFTFNPAVIANGVVVSSSYIETETELEEIGITLRITPRINADDTVTLELEQESSTINPGGATLPISDGAGNVVNLSIDTVNTARLTGTVVAHNNLTVAVGGLIRTSKTNEEKKVPVLGDIPLLGRVFRSTIESEEDTETVLLITPRIINKASDSERIRSQDNQFYQSYNDGFPDLEPYPNKFINKPAEENKSNSRQLMYQDMSGYAAETVRVSEIERRLDVNYLPAKINMQSRVPLFSNRNISIKPLASWNRGGLYVTVVELKNKLNSAQSVDYKKINGEWLSTSVENEVLARKGQRNDQTFMYLISALPFDEVMANI